MLKTYTTRLLRGIGNTASVQSSHRLFIRRSRKLGLHREQVVRELNGLPVVSRLSPTLSLPAQRRSSFESIRSTLHDAGLHFWVVPSSSSEPTVLSLRISDRAAFWRAMRSAAAYSNWYCTSLSPRYQPGPWVVPAQGTSNTHWPAARIWENVHASRDSSFHSGPAQGVDILFWEEDEEGLLQPPVWTPQATSLTGLEADHVDANGVPAVWSTYGHIADTEFTIDAVYTWVDGSDPVWLARKAAAQGIIDVGSFTERAQDDARFADHDELRYSLRSLAQFAPWINNIWIVTAGQVPEWLNVDNPKIRVVDHGEIWPDEAGLPTFNSHAIEACLHRIPGLSEHFIYLNDDMLLGRPVAPELFFHSSGIGKVFQSRALVDHRAPEPGEIASSTAAKNARKVLIRDFQKVQTQKFYHTAAALRVSVMNELEQRNPDQFAQTRRATFRTTEDVAAAGSLYLNYALAAGASVPGRIKYEYVDPATPEGRARLRKIIQTRAFDAFCLNDGSSEQLAEDRVETDRLIRAALQQYLPVPSEFEKN